MPKFKDRIKEDLKQARERDKKLEKPIERVSRLIWPWQESRLVWLVIALALLDFISTLTALNFNMGHNIQEVGLLAKWGLNEGGFTGLFLIYAVAISVLILFAWGVRALYTKFGYAGYGRSAFVFIFIPYAVIILPIVIHNFILAFR